MADEFSEHDLETPTEHDLDTCYGSKYLATTDVGDRKIKSRIAKVRKEELRGDNGKARSKFILYFDTVDKPMVVNATNKNALVDKLGRDPAKWPGATVGIFVDPNVTFAGKRVPGLRLRVLLPPTAAAAKATPKPVTQPPAAEEGDPGPALDPDFNNAVPDFGPAA